MNERIIRFFLFDLEGIPSQELSLLQKKTMVERKIPLNHSFFYSTELTSSRPTFTFSC